MLLCRNDRGKEGDEETLLLDKQCWLIEWSPQRLLMVIQLENFGRKKNAHEMLLSSRSYLTAIPAHENYCLCNIISQWIIFSLSSYFLKGKLWLINLLLLFISNIELYLSILFILMGNGINPVSQIPLIDFRMVSCWRLCSMENAHETCSLIILYEVQSWRCFWKI